MLRYRRLMSKYIHDLFLPIDTNEDDTISIDKMNTAIASIKEAPLSKDEIQFLQYRVDEQTLNWNQFIDLLLVA